MKRLNKKLIVLFAALIILVAVFFVYVLWLPNSISNPKGEVVTISKGMSFHAVADSLDAKGIVRSKWAFMLAGRFLGSTKSIKVGKYIFLSGMSNEQILRDICKGKSRLVISVTIPEGWRLEQIAHRYERELGISTDRFLQLCYDSTFIVSNGVNAPSLEGYLMPDTYSFYWQPDEEEVIKRMLDGLFSFYSDSLIERQKQLKVSLHEVLTLASIVEAESISDEERPRIAGVYWNRLKKKMRLEADPTVQYAIGKERRLLYRDLDVNSPYNTYRRIGLPPGPINNPGRASILATLYPEKHSYIYFVSNGAGGHRFASSYSEHQRNVALYRKFRREQRRLAMQKISAEEQ
ncbi:MAG TPA: endolytic transglycosylase MltG [Bacteroidota bacterium]|nr:endolytic transglycosylase MltG [Bacteroidota bacterium]